MVRAWIEAQRTNVAQSKKTLIHRHLFKVDAYNYGKKKFCVAKKSHSQIIFDDLIKYVQMIEYAWNFHPNVDKIPCICIRTKTKQFLRREKKKSINKTMKYDELLRRRRPRQWYLSATWLKWNRIDFINKRRKCGFNVLFYILLWNLHMFFWLRDFA